MCPLGCHSTSCPNVVGNQDKAGWDKNVNVLGTPHFSCNPNADQKPDSKTQCTKVSRDMLAEKTCSESGTNALLSWQSPLPHTLSFFLSLSLTQSSCSNMTRTQLLESHSKTGLAERVCARGESKLRKISLNSRARNERTQSQFGSIRLWTTPG